MGSSGYKTAQGESSSFTPFADTGLPLGFAMLKLMPTKEALMGKESEIWTMMQTGDMVGATGVATKQQVPLS